MFLSGDIRSSRDGSQKRALAGRPLRLRATLTFTELLYLPQVFPLVCREKVRSLNTKYKLVLEDGAYSYWKKHKIVPVMCFGPQNLLP